jgi:hypothetical protein
MLRANTTTRSTFTRNKNVTYLLPSPPGSSPVITITLPPSSDWTSGLHWHETHTEYLSVIRGVALITLNNITKRYIPSDGIIVVPRYARHEWRRAEARGEELVVREWTDPADGLKEVFFRNLSSVIEDEVKVTDGRVRGWWLELQIWIVCLAMDNFPVFVEFQWIPLLGNFLERLVTHFVLCIAALVGVPLSLKGVYEEYTPQPLLQRSLKSRGHEYDDAIKME